ncbi:hypothetical protein NL676_005389 [Syzygium grande]|nr:hypothetical protein NL676_005389 [Syzygium grande]
MTTEERGGNVSDPLESPPPQKRCLAEGEREREKRGGVRLETLSDSKALNSPEFRAPVRVRPPLYSASEAVSAFPPLAGLSLLLHPSPISRSHEAKVVSLSLSARARAPPSQQPPPPPPPPLLPSCGGRGGIVGFPGG